MILYIMEGQFYRANIGSSCLAVNPVKRDIIIRMALFEASGQLARLSRQCGIVV